LRDRPCVQVRSARLDISHAAISFALRVHTACETRECRLGPALFSRLCPRTLVPQTGLMAGDWSRAFVSEKCAWASIIRTSGQGGKSGQRLASPLSDRTVKDQAMSLYRSDKPAASYPEDTKFASMRAREPIGQTGRKAVPPVAVETPRGV